MFDHTACAGQATLSTSPFVDMAALSALGKLLAICPEGTPCSSLSIGGRCEGQDFGDGVVDGIDGTSGGLYPSPWPNARPVLRSAAPAVHSTMSTLVKSPSRAPFADFSKVFAGIAG
jgi:hypothetical protein